MFFTFHRKQFIFNTTYVRVSGKIDNKTKALLTNLNSVNWMYLNAEWIITAEIGGNEAMW